MGFLHDLYGPRGAALVRDGKSSGLVIIGDKAPYKSPMDRTVVEGRTAHKEHMKRHGVMEAGDMKLGTQSGGTSIGGVRSDIQRSIQELGSR